MLGANICSRTGLTIAAKYHRSARSSVRNLEKYLIPTWEVPALIDWMTSSVQVFEKSLQSPHGTQTSDLAIHLSHRAQAGRWIHCPPSRSRRRSARGSYARGIAEKDTGKHSRRPEHAISRSEAAARKSGSPIRVSHRAQAGRRLRHPFLRSQCRAD